MAEQDDKQLVQNYIAQLIGQQQQAPMSPVPYRDGAGPTAQAPMPVMAPKAKAPVQVDEEQDDSTPAPMPMKSDFGPPTMDKQNAPSVREYLMNKYGFNDSASDDALKAAQANVQKQNYAANMMQAGDTIASALGGVKSDTSFTDGLKAQALQGVQNVEQQRQAKMQGLQNNMQIQSLADKTDLDDPNSDKSKAVQNMVQKLYPGKFSQADISKIPASMADSIYKPLELDAKMQEQKDNHQMRMQMMSDSQDSKRSAASDKVMNQTQQLLEQMRGSPAVGQAEKDIYASQKLNDLVGGGKNLSPQQVQLAASEMAKIATGGTPTSHELQGLQPSTISSGLASLAQKVMNKPVGADADAFVKQMQDYSNGISKVAQQTIKDRYGRILEPRKNQLGEENYGNLTQRYTNRFDQPAAAAPQADPAKPSWAK